jgi:hypothetical protein
MANEPDYILTIKMSKHGAEDALEKFDGWEGTRHIASVPDDDGARIVTIWHVPNATVGAGIILSCGGWIDDLVWGDYRLIPNRRL